MLSWLLSWLFGPDVETALPAPEPIAPPPPPPPPPPPRPLFLQITDGDHTIASAPLAALLTSMPPEVRDFVRHELLKEPAC